MTTNPGAYHFVGIGGSGMSVIASLLAQAGIEVSGSDRVHSKTIDSLVEEGIDAYAPHGAKDFNPEATVVLSTAIQPGNPEVALAKERRQKIIHRSQALAEAAKDHRLIAVAGSHGKTTTSTMIAAALLTAGVDASYAIGGEVLGFGGGGRSGSDVFVAEADESDRSFLNYNPTVAVVLNIEEDHLENYGTLEAIEEAFDEFAAKIEPGGALVCCGEDAGSAALAGRVRDLPNIGNVYTYGRADRCEETPDVVITSEQYGPGGTTATFEGVLGHQEISLSVTGEHNLLDAAASWIACVAVGLSPDNAAAGLSAFAGAGRRFELVAEINGKRVYDDYAHHPTEVEALLRQARLASGGGRIIAVYQPLTFARTEFFYDDFAKALTLADDVILTDIYTNREDPIPGVTSRLIVDSPYAEGRFSYVPEASEAAKAGAALTGEGDMCLIIGGGDFYNQTHLVVEAWEKEL